MMRFFLTMTLIITQSLTNASTVNYHLTITDPAHHLATVEVTFEPVATKTLDIKLPVWRSGRYEILNLSKNIRHLQASQGDQGLKVEQIDKNTWRAFLKQKGAVTVQYEIYANALKQRVAHIDETHAFLDASGVFVYSPAFRDQALTVTLHVPQGWESRSGMVSLADHQFKANNYDQLVDSPIESGHHQLTSFEVDGLSYEILIWGQGNHDIKDWQQKTTALHYVAKDLWGDFPYQRYLYMIHSGDGLRGATEHVNSTIMQFDRFGFGDPKTYHRFLATAAHELIHTWNVKAYRPSDIAPYNYDEENYSKLFWMVEGSTSYYDDLFLRRADIYSQSEFLERISENLTKHLNKPGRTERSLAEASFNTWQNEDNQRNHNAGVSIYLEGAMASWYIDHQIRLWTDNEKSFDDLQRALYKNHRNSDQGYDQSDVVNLIKDITGHDFSKQWEQYIEGTESLPFDDMLKYYGLQKAENKDPKPWIGLVVDNEHVSTVDKNSPAWQAGISAGDELIALNGLRLKPHQWSKQLESAVNNTDLVVLFASGSVIKETTITVGEKQLPAVSIEPINKPSKKQKAIFESWTGHAMTHD